MAFCITDRCTGCARCVEHCPTDAICSSPRGPHEVDPARCIDCGACGVVCAELAVLDQRGELFHLGPEALPARRRAAWVDPGRCTGCGDCVSSCPFDALELVAHGPAAPVLRVSRGREPAALQLLARVRAARCVACSLCELECTRGAIVPPAHCAATAAGTAL